MKVELTSHTIDVLKNFATISSNILFQPGNLIQVVSETKSIVAQATVEEDFPVEFGIWDLSSFLGILSSFENPVLNFSDEVNVDGTARFVIISEKKGRGTFKYFGSPKNVLTVMTKEFKMPPAVVNFDISKNILQKCTKTATIASLKNIIVESQDGQTIDVVVTDSNKNKSSNEFRVQVGDNGTGNKFSLIFDSMNMKMIPGDYKVAMDGKLVSQFSNDDQKLTYYIAIERGSQFSG